MVRMGSDAVRDTRPVSEEILDVVRRWWAGFNEDGAPSLDLCHEQVEISNPPEFPVRGTYRGHDGVRQWRTDAFDVIDELKVETEKLIDVGDGETVVMLLRLRGVASHTRIPIDQPWAAVWTIRDGQLLTAQGYVSRRAAMKAAGLRD
jgi:ketosteroid isomerase-like protein